MSDLVSISKAAELLGVCSKTLRDWDKQGLLKPVRTIGKHRRYSVSGINQFLMGAKDEQTRTSKKRS
jgi:excisionase family DNA binding protein